MLRGFFSAAALLVLGSVFCVPSSVAVLPSGGSKSGPGCVGEGLSQDHPVQGQIAAKKNEAKDAFLNQVRLQLKDSLYPWGKSDMSWEEELALAKTVFGSLPGSEDPKAESPKPNGELAENLAARLAGFMEDAGSRSDEDIRVYDALCAATGCVYGSLYETPKDDAQAHIRAFNRIC